MRNNIISILILIPFLFFSQDFDENKNPFVSDKKILNLNSFQLTTGDGFNNKWKLISGDLGVSELNDSGSSLYFYSSYLDYDNISEGAFLKDDNNHYGISRYIWYPANRYTSSRWAHSKYSRPQYYFIYDQSETGNKVLRIVFDQTSLYEFNLDNYYEKTLGKKTYYIIEGNYKRIDNEDVGYENSLKKYEIANTGSDLPYTLFIDAQYTKVYHSGKINNIDLNSWIEKYVRSKINVWQQKDEFEKTVNYQKRVTNESRLQKVKELEIEAMGLLGSFFMEAIDFDKQIKLSNIDEKFKLSKYDADNETYVISINFGLESTNMVLNVPIKYAADFKKEFNSGSKSTINLTKAEYTVINNKLVLNYAEIKHNQNGVIYGSYIYDNKNQLSYVDTQIDYNFDPIVLNVSNNSNQNINNSNIGVNKISVGRSPVDVNIPVNRKVDNRYALIIGNEDYKSYQTTLSSEQNVDYAVNDATVFKNYALNTLGVKEENMFFLTNATAGQMSQEIERVSKIVSKIGEDAELVVYYAGHGYPDEINKVPYLIPVDISASNLDRAIKLDDFYTSLSSTNASKITVFLDACFTGGGRSMGLYASRGIKVRPKTGILKGNLVVFSASSSDQSSLPYHQEKHGMFTYHLLKKLQETKGDINLGDLSKYLEDEVSIQSLKVNKADQEPTVNISNQVTNQWKNWRF